MNTGKSKSPISDSNKGGSIAGYGNREGKATFHKDIQRSENSNKSKPNNVENSDDQNGEFYENLEDKWYDIEHEYCKKYSELTDEDLIIKPSGFKDTVQRIASRTNREHQAVIEEIQSWRKSD